LQPRSEGRARRASSRIPKDPEDVDQLLQELSNALKDQQVAAESLIDDLQGMRKQVKDQQVTIDSLRTQLSSEQVFSQRLSARNETLTRDLKEMLVLARGTTEKLKSLNKGRKAKVESPLPVAPAQAEPPKEEEGADLGRLPWADNSGREEIPVPFDREPVPAV
jgi:hypothetical protein